MSDHSVEILVFSPSVGYLQNPTATFGSDIREKAPDSGSLLHTFHGCSHENQTEAYLITKWEAPMTTLHTLKDAIPPHVGDTVEQFQVSFKDDSVLVFRAPVVELAFLKLKPDATKESVGGVLDTLTSQETSTVVSATWGTTNRPDVLVMIVGWESKEAHEEVVRNSTSEIKSLIGKLLGMAEIKVMHAALVEA